MAGIQDKRIISLEEVSQHNMENEDKSCWIIISGKVYDVTKFLNEHPGGEEVITQLAGKDGTDGFVDVGHSKDAIQMAEDYLIGELSESDRPKTSSTQNKKESSTAKNGKLWADVKDILTSPTWTNFFIPTTLGILIYLAYKTFIGK